jgi:hypothetical protein
VSLSAPCACASGNCIVLPFHNHSLLMGPCHALLPFAMCRLPGACWCWCHSVSLDNFVWHSLPIHAVSEYQQTLICCHSSAAVPFGFCRLPAACWCWCHSVSLSPFQLALTSNVCRQQVPTTLICCHSTAALPFLQVAWCLLVLKSLSVPCAFAAAYVKSHSL